MAYFSEAASRALFTAELVTALTVPSYLAARAITGYWSVPRQVEYITRRHDMMLQLEKLADRNGDGAISTREEGADVRRRTGANTDNHLLLTLDQMERAIASYKTDLNKEGKK